MEMKLVNTKSNVNEDGVESKRETYELGRYTVIVDYLDGKVRDVDVLKSEQKRFLPEIVPNFLFRLYGENVCFKIQTTSYGAMKSEEIEKVVDGFEHALEVVKVLEKRFC